MYSTTFDEWQRYLREAEASIPTHAHGAMQKQLLYRTVLFRKCPKLCTLDGLPLSALEKSVVTRTFALLKTIKTTHESSKDIK
jgi:hypothetical protein